MSRVFLSHSRFDSREAVAAVKQWLIEQEPGLVDEIYLDLDPHTGIRPGERWKEALNKASARCEAVICLLSKNWLNSAECNVEFRYAENLHKAILCAQLEPLPDTNITSEWQRCDLFPNHRPTIDVDIADGGEPVVLDRVGLQQLLDGLHTSGIAAEHFLWPPPDDPDRAPYRGWAPLEEADAAVFFGRDAQILRGLDALHGMRSAGVESLFVILGPSGAGKSSFLRAGLLPRLRRDDRRFLLMPIVRPERAVLTGQLGLAHAIHGLRTSLALPHPMLGEIKTACHPEHVERLRGWLEEARQAARARLLDVPAEQPAPTLVLPVDQAEELFNVDAGAEAPHFLQLLASLVEHEVGVTPAMILAVTIRADRFEPLQTAPELDPVHPLVFPDLKPLPPAGYTEVITGPARRATAAGSRLTVEPALVDRLLTETAEGADALPLLALTLERLYRDFDDGDLTEPEYESMGGMAQVVQTEVDNLLAADPEERQAQLDTLHNAFIPWLATINPDSDQPMRRLARWVGLPAESHPLIQTMVDKRLLVKDTRDGETVVEVALESLLRQWRELAAWLRDEAQDLKDADSLERAAADWQASGRYESWLLEGTRLTEAETVAAKPGFRDRLDPTRDFLQASRSRETDRIEADKQRQEAELRAAREHAAALRKRSRILLGVVAVTVVVALVAAYFLVDARRARDEADSRFRQATASRLAADAQAVLAGARTRDDIRTIQQTLAAERLSGSSDPMVLLPTLNALSATEKIIDTGRPVLIDNFTFRADGRRVVTVDGKAREWNTNTGQLVGKPITADKAIYDATFSPAGDMIATVEYDPANPDKVSRYNSVRLWKTDTHEQIGEPITTPTRITDIAFSRRGDRLATATTDRQIQVWDTASKNRIGRPLTALHRIRAVAFSPLDPSLIVAAEDVQNESEQMAKGGLIEFWNVDTDALDGAPVATPPMTAFALSPDGHQIVTGISDYPQIPIQRWDVDSRLAIGEPMLGHSGLIDSLGYSPDGDYIASVAVDRTLRIWDARTGELLTGLRGHSDQVTGVAFSNDGHRLVTTSLDGTVRVWRLPLPEPSLARDIPELRSAGTGAIKVEPASFAFGPDVHSAVLGTVDGTIWVLDPRTLVAQGPPMTGHTDSVKALAVSPNGRRIASASYDGTVRLWDAQKHRPIGQPPKPPEDNVNRRDEMWQFQQDYALKFSGDSRRLLSYSEQTKQVWDAETGQPIGHPLTGCTVEGSRKDSVALSRDGHRVAAGCDDNTVRVWDADTGEPVGKPMQGHEYPPRDVAFTPDGRRIVSVSLDSVRVWDTDTQQRIAEHQPPRTMDAYDSFSGLAVSDDGRYIVTGGSKSIYRWDGTTGDPIGAPMRGLQNDRNDVLAFTHDGRYIVSTDLGALRFWDTATGASVGEPLNPMGRYATNTLVVGPDDRMLYTSSLDGELLWPGPAAWHDEMCDKLTANMSHKQWSEWVSPNIGYEKLCEHLDVPPDDQGK